MKICVFPAVFALLAAPAAHAGKAQTFGVKQADIVAAIDCADYPSPADCDCVKRESVDALKLDNLQNIMPRNMPREHRAIMEKNLFALKRAISIEEGRKRCGFEDNPILSDDTEAAGAEEEAGTAETAG